MTVTTIFLSSAGLMLGSLLTASLLTMAAWWLTDRVQRAWPVLVLLALYGAVLFLPLAESLFVRMIVIFGALGAAPLYFVTRGHEGTQSHEPTKKP